MATSKLLQSRLPQPRSSKRQPQLTMVTNKPQSRLPQPRSNRPQPQLTMVTNRLQSRLPQLRSNKPQLLTMVTNNRLQFNKLQLLTMVTNNRLQFNRLQLHKAIAMVANRVVRLLLNQLLIRTLKVNNKIINISGSCFLVIKNYFFMLFLYYNFD